MAYTKKNYLQRIVDVQNITLEHTNRGVSQKWVYENIIYPRFYISNTTYYAYLATPAKAELRKIMEENNRQTVLF